MKRRPSPLLHLTALLSALLLASSAEAAVERKLSFRGETADAFFRTTSGADGCLVTELGVLTNELEQKLAVDGSMNKIEDVFEVVTLNMFNQCDEPGLPFSGYSDSTLDVSRFSLSIDPQHNRARMQARLLMQEDAFVFYWITIDISWTIGQPATEVDLSNYTESGDGITVWRSTGTFMQRPARAVASVTVVPYATGSPANHPYVGEGISFSMDSIDSPQDVQELTRYSKTKVGERTIYRAHDYVAPEPH